MPTVSVLIPAYRPRFLRSAILSALNQSYQDLEVLVGDDNAEPVLHSLIQDLLAADARLRYIHHGFNHTTKNCIGLWNAASGRYIKWLFDDDLLLPESVSTLLAALAENPGSPIAFHERVWIDERNNVLHKAPPLLPNCQYASLDRDFLVKNMVGSFTNFIGEPTTTLIDRKLYPSFDNAYIYKGYSLIFLADVGLYLNCTELGPATAVSGVLSAFRRHSGQASQPNDSPILSAGYFEWEMMLRGEATHARWDSETLLKATQFLRSSYGQLVDRYPELAPLLEGLRELDEPHADLFRSPSYLANLESARSQVLERFFSRRKGL